MTRSKHPAILKFPVQADRISELMRSNKEFASICRDYAEIVDDIAREERTPGHSSAVLDDLLRLRSDLESDIFEWLSEAEKDLAASEQDPAHDPITPRKRSSGHSGPTGQVQRRTK